MAQRKCPKCKHWNTGKDYCEKCHTPLSAEAIAREREILLLESEKNKPKDKTDLWLERLKNHKSIIVRYLYYLVYSVWSIFMAIVAFVVWLVVGTNG